MRNELMEIINRFEILIVNFYLISVPPLHREVRRKSGKYNGNNPTVMSYDVLPRASVDSESSLGKPTSPQGKSRVWIIFCN